MTDAELESMTFEQLLDALEQLTRQMASGGVGIEEAAALYERAGVLHAAATERLDRVQRRIDELRPPAAATDGQD
jgi:exodeoxyribonuclease VII small subunit